MPRKRKPARLDRVPGKPSWYILDYDANGQRIRISTRTGDEGAAKCALAEWLAAKERQKDPTILELLSRRQEALSAAAKSRAKITPYLHKALIDDFGSLRAHHLTQTNLNVYRQKRAHVPAQLREELLELRKVLKDAKRDKLIAEVPHIEIPEKSPPRDEFMTKEQAALLLGCTKPLHLHLYLMIAMTTGARNGAILDLTWDRVDLENKRLNFHNPAKRITNKRRAIVPIEGGLLAALQTAKTFRQTDHVIEYMGKPVNSVKTAFKKVAADAGLAWVTPHVLKHSVVSWLAQAGSSVEQISAITGTHPATVRRIYMHFSPDYLQGPAQILALPEGFAHKLPERSPQTDVLHSSKMEKVKKNK